MYNMCWTGYRLRCGLKGRSQNKNVCACCCWAGVGIGASVAVRGRWTIRHTGPAAAIAVALVRVHGRVAELFLCDLNKITRRTPRIASRRSTQLLPLSRHTLRRNAKRGSPLRRASLGRAAGLVRSAVPPGNGAPGPRSWVTGGYLDRTRERAKTRLLLLEAREGTLLAGRQESRDGGLGSHLEQMPDQRHPRTHGGARGGAHH